MHACARTRSGSGPCCPPRVPHKGSRVVVIVSAALTVPLPHAQAEFTAGLVNELSQEIHKILVVHPLNRQRKEQVGSACAARKRALVNRTSRPVCAPWEGRTVAHASGHLQPPLLPTQRPTAHAHAAARALPRGAQGLNEANVVLLRGCGCRINVPDFHATHGMHGVLVAPTKIIAGACFSACLILMTLPCNLGRRGAVACVGGGLRLRQCASAKRVVRPPLPVRCVRDCTRARRPGHVVWDRPGGGAGRHWLLQQCIPQVGAALRCAGAAYDPHSWHAPPVAAVRTHRATARTSPCLRPTARRWCALPRAAPAAKPPRSVTRSRGSGQRPPRVGRAQPLRGARAAAAGVGRARARGLRVPAAAGGRGRPGRRTSLGLCT